MIDALAYVGNHITTFIIIFTLIAILRELEKRNKRTGGDS